jgi:phenylalanyl-tRNA synthetase beta chain
MELMTSATSILLICDLTHNLKHFRNFMLISLNWIKDFVELPALSAKELASKFTLATAEVEEIKIKGEALASILCVEIKSLRPHPEADKLNLVTFDFGQGQLKEVVCGAPNVRVGLKVPYAPIGTTLPNGLTLEPKKIRGILSDGMLCSETELGIGEGTSGLMELSADVVPGTSILEYLNIKPDVILDVDNKSLTHRPDLWGYLGLAREFAAAHKVALKNPFTGQWQQKIEGLIPLTNSPIKIEVDPNSSCLAYYGLSMANIKMGPTPDWMIHRLESAGLRSINLIVDISNYVMIELGIPNHIFDRQKISGDKISIKTASQEMKFTTLDEVQREITSTDTLIWDNQKPLVLAGLMGGQESGVSDTTTELFLEVANWDASQVRKTSVRLGLRTDSSQRYEKTLDSNQCYQTLLRLVELITQLSPGAKVEGRVESYLNESKLSKPLLLSISHAQIINALGMEISPEAILDIFTRLDFTVEHRDAVFNVTVPSYRTTKDISCTADLVEEIGRIIGYDNIATVSPIMPVRPVRLSTAKLFHRKIQNLLVYQARCLEVMTYPLTGPSLLKQALWPEANEHLRLVNSISVEHDRMRPSMIPSAIEVAANNQKNFERFAFFELGRSYLNFENERTHLLIGMYSKTESRFLELVNTVEKLLPSLNISANLTGKSERFENPVMPSIWAGIHPYEYLNIQVMGKFSGAMTTVHPLVLKNFKMKGHLSLAVLDITELQEKEMKDKTKYTPLSKFPSATFDLTVVMNNDLPSASTITALNTLKNRELKSKSIVGVFKINEEQKAVTLRTVFEDPEKTLPPENIKELELKVIQVLEKAGFPLRT